jgi:hypothetical protein
MRTTVPRVAGILLVMGIAVLGVARASAAQDPVESFSLLPQVIKKGNVVFVQDDKGERTKGKITELSDTSLRIMTGGVMGRTLTFPADRVSRVSKLDSRWNGFIIGAIAGAVPGMLAGYWWSAYSNNEAGGPSNWGYVYFGSALIAVGGGIGYAIDGAIDGQTLVFRRSTVARMRVEPMIGDRAGGARFSLRF